MSKVDCLVEVTASFFAKGSTTSWAYIENEFSLFSVGDVEKCIESFKPQPELEDYDFARLHCMDFIEDDIDTRFTEDVIAFSFHTFGEGRMGDTYGCGVDYDVDQIGWDEVANDWREDLINDAKLMREELLARYKAKDNEQWIKGNASGSTILRWLAAVEYWTDGDGVYTDFDSGVYYLGRVKMQTVQTMPVLP